MTWLIHQNVDFIFYPCIPYERNEFPDSNNHYNCPIVTSYAENIKNNVDEITAGQVTFLNPFMSFASEETLILTQLIKAFGQSEFGFRKRRVRDAVAEGWKELAVMPAWRCRKKARKPYSILKETGRRGIVLAGRPYHVDPEINHGIPELITSYGIAVLTEDSVSHLQSAGAPADRYGSVDVPLQTVRSGELCQDKRRSRPDPAELLRLWSGCRYDRSVSMIF